MSLVLATLCWGSTVVLVEVASGGLSAATITGIEMLVALLCLSAFAVVTRSRLGRPNRTEILAGLLEPGLAYLLINAGLARTSGTHGAIIIGLESALVVAISSSVSRRLPRPREVMGVAFALVGILVVAGRPTGSASLLGDAVIFLGVVCAAAYVVVAERALIARDPLPVTFYQFVFGSIVIVPVIALSFASDGVGVGIEGNGLSIIAAVAAGIVGSALAFGLYNVGLARAGSVLAGTSLALIPVFGVMLSVALLGERLSWSIAVGGALVVSGVLLTLSSSPDSDATAELGRDEAAADRTP